MANDTVSGDPILTEIPVSEGHRIARGAAGRRRYNAGRHRHRHRCLLCRRKKQGCFYKTAAENELDIKTPRIQLMEEILHQLIW